MNIDRRFSLRENRRLLFVWFCLISLLIITGAYLYLQMRTQEARALIALEEQHHIEIQSAVLDSDLTHVAYMLSYLRDQVRLHGYGDSALNRTSFAQDIYSFMQSNELYDQIRFIDADGMEVVRVDYNRGTPDLVTPERLQFKGDRYYFKQSMSLGENEIYISPLDLNVEHGKIEEPYKPVIRFAMPVFSQKGEILGVLIVNHLASTMLDAFKKFASPSNARSMLLNEDGYWFSHPDTEQQWGFMFEDMQGQSMKHQSPVLWQKVMKRDYSQFDFDGDIVSVGTVYPFSNFSTMRKIKLSSQARQCFWKIVSIYPEAELNEQLLPLKTRITVSVLLSMLASLLLLVLWRRSILRKVEAEKEREKLLQQLQELSRRLIDLREEEVRRIASALHDDMGQVLVAIQMQVGLTEKFCQAGAYAEAKASIGRIKKMSGDLSLVIRNQLYAIRPGHLHEIGLEASVEELCREWRKQLDIALRLEKMPEDLPDKLQLCLFRVVQESLTNVVKHSGATLLEIELTHQNDEIWLQCRDNGCGFDVANVVRGLGLFGMQERISALGGSMHVDSSKGRGVRLEMRLPWPCNSSKL
ncbi:MAG: hypothetical protein COW58_14985 [Thalassolituus sp. CG17_big_fil_post_rev_8_21_14_2_50_53_8]|nr:MAG: hypothetical protein COW58_14985 [Thalassolituus sp. CG17_big_fil_post_rev_8_21_14_2_50_53_8]